MAGRNASVSSSVYIQPHPSRSLMVWQCRDIKADKMFLIYATERIPIDFSGDQQNAFPQEEM